MPCVSTFYLAKNDNNDDGCSIEAYSNAIQGGNAGNITIKTNNLLLKDVAEINTSTAGTGLGGHIDML